MIWHKIIGIKIFKSKPGKYMKNAILHSALILSYHLSFSGTCGTKVARPEKSEFKTHKKKMDNAIICTLISKNKEIVKTTISWPQHGGHLIVTEDKEEMSAKYVIEHRRGAFRK